MGKSIENISESYFNNFAKEKYTNEIIRLKKEWDLGIQKSCFLGLESNKEFTGLLNNSGVKINKNIIKKPISKITNSKELEKLVFDLIKEYKENSNGISPNRFLPPIKDYYGFGTSFNKITVRDFENEFKKLVGGDFKVLELIYSNKEENKDFKINTDRYVLYNYEINNLSRYIPIDLTQKSINVTNSTISQIMYAKFSSVTIEKPETMIYFDFDNSISKNKKEIDKDSDNEVIDNAKIFSSNIVDLNKYTNKRDENNINIKIDNSSFINLNLSLDSNISGKDTFLNIIKMILNLFSKK